MKKLISTLIFVIMLWNCALATDINSFFANLSNPLSATSQSTDNAEYSTGSPVIENNGDMALTDKPAIALSGQGQEASEIFTLKKGLAIFNMKYSGTSNFIIWLLDSNGDKVGLLANEIGAFNGAQALEIPGPGDYILDVDADGPWTVDIAQPETQTAQGTPASFKGAGKQVSPFLMLKPGLTIFKMTHDGESNFIVTLLDSNGRLVELLTNVIGTFDGSKAVGIQKSGIYCLNIVADGEWNIEVSQAHT
jgi:hypothetical protein